LARFSIAPQQLDRDEPGTASGRSQSTLCKLLEALHEVDEHRIPHVEQVQIEVKRLARSDGARVQMLRHGKPPREAVRELMERSLKGE
jgi:nucleotide-binding universal stress UspA family protein